MSGGLLNLVAVGAGNLFLTGNPTKTFFKIAYSKYTNFGLQKFRLDYDGIRDLRTTDESLFTFKVKRYGDLLMDTYLVLTLPDIYSPIFNPCAATNQKWSAYEFKWIRNLGTQLIRQVEIFCGNQRIQTYSGHYLGAMIDRDFGADKKELIDRMTGNVPEFFDPANTEGRVGVYPNAYCPPTSSSASASASGTEPSIRGRRIYIPINAWFSLSSKCAFPLISSPFTEISINVTLRPVQELFQMRDVFDFANNFPYIQPDFQQDYCKMYRFLQSPPSDVSSADNYTNHSCLWNADIHLISTYAFLSDDERTLFATESQMYLVKDVFEYTFLNVVGTKRLELTSNGMIANWMITLQRNDANQRNEWSNYTNWAYSATKPQNATYPSFDYTSVTPAFHPDGTNTGYLITGDFCVYNHKPILETMAIVFDGKYRENVLESGVFAYLEKYIRTAGAGSDGLYCYNFGLNTSPFEYQPSGAINLTKFRTIELEITTYIPPFNSAGLQTDILCINSATSAGVTNRPNWMLYEYGYNVRVMEERYNLLTFMNGECGLQYSR